MAPQNQQRNLLAMLLSGGGRGDPYANQASGPFASSPRVYGSQSPDAGSPQAVTAPPPGPVPVPILRPDTGGGGAVPVPLPRPPNPVTPPYTGPFIPSPVSQRNRYAGSPDPLSGRYMPWIHW